MKDSFCESILFAFFFFFFNWHALKAEAGKHVLEMKTKKKIGFFAFAHR